MVSEVADIIADVIGRPVTYNDFDPEASVGAAAAAGAVPADYVVMLRWLTKNISSGKGSRPDGDIEKVTGKLPATFHQRNAAAWAFKVVK